MALLHLAWICIVGYVIIRVAFIFTWEIAKILPRPRIVDAVLKELFSFSPPSAHLDPMSLQLRRLVEKSCVVKPKTDKV